MNRGLILKALRETWTATLVFGLALLSIEALLAYILPTFSAELATIWMQIEIVQTLLKALLGGDAAGALGPHVMTALPWVHPAVLALVWAHAISFSTRVPAGEVDRGTIDVLFGLPVSRWQVYISETIAWLVSGAALLVLALLGAVIGNGVAQKGTFPDGLPLGITLLNFYCLGVSVWGIGCFVSALSDRKGRAVGWVFGIIVASFLVNFLAEFWEPARALRFLSLLDYYRPMLIFDRESWPIGDMAALLGIGATLWTAGGVIFRRRDICTV